MSAAKVDPFQHAKETHPARLNALAQCVQGEWEEFVPLSVRYAAAEAADAIVRAYMENVSEWSVAAAVSEGLESSA